MKIVYFATYYTPYLSSLYAENIGLSEKSYQEQFQIISNDYFGSFISYHNWTIKLGNESSLVIANCEPLQKKWAKENDFLYSEKNWQKEISLAQVKAFTPDVFYMGSMFDYYGEFLDEVKKICKNIFGWISCPIGKDVNIKQMDLIFSSASHYVDKFKKLGINSELVSPGFDSLLLDHVNEFDSKIPFSFIGGVSQAHSNRISAIREVVGKSNLEIWGYNLGELILPTNRLSFKKKQINKIIGKRLNGEIWGLEMYELLYNSKITFNSHINMAEGKAINMRMYEATGMGTMLLTDGNPKSSSFIDGKDVVFYSSIQDAIEKVKYYLEHEEERLMIAKSGQEKTIKNFSYEIITKQMIDYFIKYLK